MSITQFDQGTEFYNKEVKSLLNKHNIEFFSTYSDKKAAVVERFNRTLKALMWKYFYRACAKTWTMDWTMDAARWTSIVQVLAHEILSK